MLTKIMCVKLTIFMRADSRAWALAQRWGSFPAYTMPFLLQHRKYNESVP